MLHGCRYPEDSFVNLRRLCESRSRDDLVFPRLRRRLPPTASLGRRLVRRGRAKHPDLPAITVHDLRHTCASLAFSTGVNVLALQRMLGHGSAKVTLDVYASLFDADLDDVALQLRVTCAPETVGITVGILWAQGA